MTKAVKTHWFILGREPLLSAAELVAVLKLNPADYVFAPPILKVNKKIVVDDLINKLGGTIKIAQEIGNNLTQKQLTDAIIKELDKIEGKINFGISAYSYTSLRGGEERADVAIPNHSELTSFAKNLGYEIKNQLKTTGQSVRFVYNGEAILSSVTVEKNKLTERGREFILLKKNGVFDVAITRAVQPFAQFSARDYGRPGRNDKSGMLPPKLAMMMMNLAVNQENKKLVPSHVEGTKKQDFTILDPFCGSGTILTEAALLGYTNLIGSDISEKAIVDTQKNFDWLRSNSPLEGGAGDIGSPRLFQSNITNLSDKFSSRPIDSIVTEPYMGPLLFGNEKPDKLKTTCGELASLYIKAFTIFKKILKPGSTVVFLIPRYFIKGKWYTIADKIIPQLKELGFAKDRLLPEEISASNYLLYHRPGQFVGREVWRFKC